jgi:PAS domain S-box-containing protein
MTAAPGPFVLDVLFEDAPIGFAFFDRDLRYVRVNEKLAEINGLPVEAHVGHTVRELLPNMEERVTHALQRVLETGEPVLNAEFVGRTPAATDERRFATSFYPVKAPDGDMIGIGCVAVDITPRRRAQAEREQALEVERDARAEAEAAARRARFLAEAGVILDESLDYDSTLTAVSRLAVPWLADWCAIDICDADGTIRRVTTAHVDPAKVQMAADIEHRYPQPADTDRGVSNVLATGHSEIYPEIPDELLREGAQDKEHLALLRTLGIHSVMIVPMIARGRTLGAITFVISEPGRPFGDADLQVAEELARRAASSVENARLYGERAYIAHTLQESLLPPRLPDVPGIDLAGLYRPTGEGNEVGGDFYDVFELGPDSWAVVIGDVCGKGASAAALTALVRYTVRAIASADKAPSEVLRELNDAILRQRSDGRFCTVAYARLTRTPGGARIEVSNGGHPLPILIRPGGQAEVVGEPGTLLGVVPDPTLHDLTVELAERETFVLYTDGITEAGAPDRLLGPEELVDAVRKCAVSEPGEVAACLEEAAVEASGGDPHDDIAIVAIHIPAGSADAVEREMRVSAPT